MNGIQIQGILNVIEDASAQNRDAIRREVTAYLHVPANMDALASALANSGEAVIPTSYGGLRLTKSDLELVAA